MAINIFKNKKEEKKETILPVKKEAKKKEADSVEVKPSVSKEKKIHSAWQFLKKPHVTEKATDLSEKNQYVFNVFKKTNKYEVKKAIEDIYGVKVVSVRMINIPRKKRRLGKSRGWKEGYRKAIAKVKEGQKIEIMPR